MSENRINSYRTEESKWPFGASTSEFVQGLPLSPSATTFELYAVAWVLSKRDYELNKLFNGPFDYQI